MTGPNTFTESTLNDTSGATGGGVSALFSVPVYQKIQGILRIYRRRPTKITNIDNSAGASTAVGGQSPSTNGNKPHATPSASERVWRIRGSSQRHRPQGTGGAGPAPLPSEDMRLGGNPGGVGAG
jgi:hypothetical protein